MFQDLPLSLQVLVTPRFFALMSSPPGAEGEMDAETGGGGFSDAVDDGWGGHASSLVAKAGNELLVWLTEVRGGLLMVLCLSAKCFISLSP